ncbi:hypothetical protein Mzhil_1474 [Methanosalsum zhilinae DSM 4017]|uniref:Uncharacterized protein n=1 Tax=Methanosalsum zhilinae (strain DSM 4017 / NBRC 107636 / OCM 62 / WeN5) TaxID=679901 RepID=F7XNV6_METZD|nr:hypothetical protein [Methanosalsum zhilinae]AEH61313.1 hypothetical protein Mzhil_1474 [Methanosalsum zhilinae DSM 4017]
MGYKKTKESSGTILYNDGGQLTIDYLVAIIIFMAAVFFVFQYTSGLFLSFHSSSDDLNIISDQISSNVVEKKLSIHDPGVPVMICQNKVHVFFRGLDDDYDSLRESLGLTGIHSDLHLNVTLRNSTGVIDTSGQNLPYAGNIGQTGRTGLMQYENGSHELVIISFRVW